MIRDERRAPYLQQRKLLALRLGIAAEVGQLDRFACSTMDQCRIVAAVLFEWPGSHGAPDVGGAQGNDVR